VPQWVDSVSSDIEAQRFCFFSSMTSLQQYIRDKETCEYVLEMINACESKQEIREALAPFAQEYSFDLEILLEQMNQLEVIEDKVLLPVAAESIIVADFDTAILAENSPVSVGKQRKKVSSRQKKISANETMTKEPLIQGSSQQSRFHQDTLETLSNDVDLKGVNLMIGDNPILIDSELKLFTGVKYGLIGRNGTGKSTIFKAIAFQHIIGFPKNIKVHYVQQLDDVSPHTIVLDTVLNADWKTSRYQKEANSLLQALETADPIKVAIALREINLQRMNAELQLQQQVAAKLSGSRGAQARANANDLEFRISKAREDLERPVLDQEQYTAISQGNELLQEIVHILQIAEQETALSRATRILKGLGLKEEWIKGPIGNLSGGWRIRVSLAQALFLKPDLLLLDEPTNHLDLPAIFWLQNYLKTLVNVTLVVVSHDRSFLDAVTEEIIILRHQKLTYHVGNYTEYRENLENLRNWQTRAKDGLDRRKEHMENSIKECLKQAKEKGDDKKLQMVAQRTKKLNERFGLERDSKGFRYKKSKMEGKRKMVTVDKDDPPIVWKFPESDSLRNANAIIEVENISFAYGTDTILSKCTMNVSQSSRIGIVGPNGAGKSTLVKLLMGIIQPNSGSIIHNPSARIGYLSQQTVDEIRLLDSKISALDYIKSKYPNELEKELRSHFGGFGIGKVMNQPVVTLSGGQAVRIAIGIATYNAPHLLILDEPSNHLDMDSIEALIEAVHDYNGSTIIVSHDQYFIRETCKEIYTVFNKKVTRIESIDEYLSMLQQ
jgi:ATPase subunit of ABC transporter with duplicated ATPase domains